MRIIRISSESGSDDDIPLGILKNGYPDPNSYASLCRQSYEACEFCDKISRNRYASLIHNVRHIIIPLLNQAVVQCKTCLHHFTSQDDLREHTIKKHHTSLNTSFHKIEPIYFGTRNDGEGIVPSNKFEIQPFSRPKLDESEIIVIENDIEESETSSVSIKNRLIFEDDLMLRNCDRLLNDLTTDCKVKLEVFGTPWLNEEFAAKTVHYNELVKPGVYRCKKCGKGFPVRYDAIIHETSHLTFKNCQISHCNICNEYIEGDIIKLKRHYLNYHKENNKKETVKVAEIVPFLKNNVINETNSLQEKKYAWKFVSLCEICLSFLKNKSVCYEFVETVSEMGKRFKCDECGSRCFELHRIRKRLRKRIQFHKKKKIKSNEDRLKMIQNRFKMLKH